MGGPTGSNRLQLAAMRAWQIGSFECDHREGTCFACPGLRAMLDIASHVPADFDTFIAKIHPGDRAAFTRALTRVREAGAPALVKVRCRVVGARVGVTWIECRLTCEFDEAGQAPCFTRGAVMDVSDVTRLEAALKRNEARLEQAIQASRVGLYEHTLYPPGNGEPPYWSASMRELIGYAQEADADFAWFGARIHPDDLDAMARYVAHVNAPAHDRITEMECRWFHPDGSTRWFLSRGRSYFGEVDGKRVALRSVGGVMDITQLKASEADRQLKAALLDATPDLVGMANADGYAFYLNRSSREFFGFGPDDDISQWHVAQAHPEGEARVVLDVGWPTARRDGMWKNETEFLRKDGAIVPMSQIILAHHDRDGSLSYLSSIARDMTREKELEAQFRQSQKLEAIGRLAGGVAHDFNNLLTAISGFTELAMMALPPDHPACNELCEVQRATRQAASLTGQLLAFGRKQMLRPRVIDANRALQEFLPMLERLLDESIRIEVVLAPEPVPIKADPHQIQQILLNLGVNARDAMPDGGVLTIASDLVELEALQACSEQELPGGHYAWIRVSDTGHGMDEETRARAFEPFFTTKPPGEGSGLGLSTVFGIVRQSGGDIRLRSEPGRGTAVELFFPRCDEPIDEPAAAAPTAERGAGGVILVVEDNLQVLRMVEKALSRAGYRVLAAGTPSEALATAAAFQGEIDLLLTDVRMPGVDGRALAERIVAQRPGLRVVYMSGYTEDSIVHQGALEEGVLFIPKPLSPKKLLSELARVLAQGDAPGRPAG